MERLAALAPRRPAAADLIDALAEALLELPPTLEVHVRRWPDAEAFGFVAAYWAERARSYLAAGWDSPALREAMAERQPVATDDPAALPAGLVGRLMPGTPIAILALGGHEQPWGVAAVIASTAAPLSGPAVGAMATLAAIASLSLGADEYSLTQPPPPVAPAVFLQLSEEVSRARRHRSGVTLLVIEIEELTGRDAEADPLAGLADAVEQALRAEFRDFDNVQRLAGERFGVVLPGAAGEEARSVARRVIRLLQAVGLQSAGQREPLGVVVGVAEWQAGESPGAFLARATSLVADSEPNVRGALDDQAGPTPNLPGEC